jgi:tetratricopeptide (TPR) repeat protein
VNTASRVQSVAAPGQVWVDETTRLLTSSAITYVDAGSHQLKGKVDPVPLWSVRAVVAARGGGQRADGLEAPLVGRDRELRLVKELFHAAEETRSPSLVVVDGDPGVGKSRLAWEFEKYVDGLSTDVCWHRGRCVAYGEGVAFYALADAVRGRLGAAVPDLDDDRDVDPERLLDLGLAEYVADPEEREWLRPRLGALVGTGSVGTFAREDLFSAWATFLERVGAGTDAVVLVIEDAQHADEGLLSFVEHLLTVASFPCFVMMLTRPGLLDAHPTLATNRRSTVVHLPTLSRTDMSKLLGGLVAGLPDDVRSRLVERAEGVPLFAVETVRSLIDRDLVIPRGGQYVLADPAALDLDAVGAPASLQALISARLDALSTEQRRVVDRASVLGGSFHREEIAALCTDVDDLDRVLGELVRLQILSKESSRLSSEFGQFQFVQSVVRQVAYSTLSRRDRKAVHLAVVELLLEDVESSEDVVPMIAQHYLDAVEAVPGDEDVPELQRRAIEQLERAAARASALGSPGEAAGHLSRALANATEPQVRARLDSDLAEALVAAGQYDVAVRHAAAAVEQFDALDDPVAAGLAAARQAAGLAFGLGDAQSALAVAQPRWEALRHRRDADTTLLRLSQALSAIHRYLSLDMRDIIEDRLRIAERAGATDAIADSFLALAVHYAVSGVPSLGRVLTEAGADLAREQHRPLVLGRALTNLTSDWMTNDLERALAFGREAVEVASRTGSSYMISFARVNLALVLLEQGGWSELESLLAEGDQEASNISTFLAAEAVLAEARSRHWVLSWTPETRLQSSDPATMAWQLHAEALAARAAGDTAEALALGLSAVEMVYEHAGRWDDFPHLWEAAAETAVRAGDDTQYARLAELAGDDDERVPVSLLGHRARMRALWALREGPDAAGAEDSLRAAVEHYERWASRVCLAKTRADLGVCLSAQGRAEEARPLLAAARATYVELGATAWLAALDQELTPYRAAEVLQ